MGQKDNTHSSTALRTLQPFSLFCDLAHLSNQPPPPPPRMDDPSLQKDLHNAWPQLVDFLSHNPEWVLQKAKQLLPEVDMSQVEGIANNKEKISLVLDMFRRSLDASVFNYFMQSVCMECTLPLELEIICMSAFGEGHVTPVQEDFEETDTQFPSTSTRPERRRPWSSPPTSNNGKQSKQQRLDSAERYRQRIITAMLQRYGANKSGQAAEGETRQSAFSQAFVNLVIRQSKACKIKGKTKEEPIALHEGEEHSDATMRLSDLFKNMPSGTTNVILLLGKPGMGKTRLVHKICQQWAEGMLPQYQLIFLFEFRQLNLISRRLSLRELLFDFFLHPEDCPDAVLEHLLEDARHALLIFDGMDEFVGNIKQPFFPISLGLDNSKLLLVSELFASLCHGNLLPGCTVLVTTRPKILPNTLLKTVTLLAEIWGFDHEKVEEYACYFFHRNALKNQAITCLRSNSKLLSMCYIPALCNIVCICLEYLLLQDVKSGQLPQTMTQFYIKMVLIFISKSQRSSGVSEEAGMSRHQAAIASLCELAFKGLEEKKVLFYAGEVPERARDFASLYGLLLAFKVKASNGSSQDGYTFVHFSFQEFFAALFLLTSKTIDDNCLREKFFLRSKWILKKESKMTFTENCHVFLSGLSSQGCRQFLSSLTGQNESWIEERQAIITQMLRKLARASLTGPKVVELCHCVCETQDRGLAQHVAAQLNFNYQFRNFRLMPLDLTSLAFVINNSSPNLVSLGFVGCPMELEYLDVLASCENIKNLSFQSRRYGNEFAAVLSRSLPKIKRLTTFQLAGGNITISGLEDLLRAFADCQQLEDINLQDNRMKEQEMIKIIEIFYTVEKLKKIDLSHNKISANTILAFCRAAAVSPNVTALHIRKNTLTINFTGHSIKSSRLQHLGIKEEETVPHAQTLKLRLQDCQLYPQHAEEIASILGSCSHLSEIDLSGNNLGDEGCRKLVEMLSKMSIFGPLNLNNNQLSLESIFYLLNSMKICPNIQKLEASLHQKTAVLTLANKMVTDAAHSRSYSLNDDQLSTDKERMLATSRKICLTGNNFQGEDLENLCLALRSCRSVTELDLSNNSLGDLGVLKVAELLQDMKALRSVILNQNDISLSGVFHLVQSFSTLEQMTSIHLDLGNTQSVHLSFRDRFRSKLTGEHEGELLSVPAHHFSLRDCAMAPQDVARLFGILNTCSGLSEINFSRNILSDQGIEELLEFLPRLHSLKLLSIRNNTFSRNGVLLLANTFNLCERICEVEVRSSENAFLHFVDSQESREIHCRLIDCNIGQDDIKGLCVIFEKSSCLVELDLSRNCLGDDGLRCLLEHLPRIHISCLMKISHNGISQDGVLFLVNALAMYPNVAEVHVSLCSEETLVITLASGNNPQKILRLKQCNFQAEHLAQLTSMLGKCFALTDFMLANNGLTLSDAEALFRAPEKLTGVLRMGIEEQWVKKESLVGLLKLAVEVQGNIMEVMIRRDTSLFVVEQGFPYPAEKAESVVSRLHKCELEAKRVPLLPKLIEKCQRLCALNLSEVQLTDSEAATISDALFHFPALKRLELTCCRISPFGTEQLVKALNQCQAIEEINISKCNFGTDGLSALVNALEGKLHLKNINLGFLNLESRSTLKLISKLSTIPPLRRLVLNNNNLGSDVCLHLAEMLKNAIHMEEINLSYNEIEDAGVKEIATAIPEMKNLKQINLSHNGISWAGGQCFVDALAGSQQVEELRLSENTIGHKTVAKLAAILPSVHRLKVLHLSSCSIDSEGISHLAKALSECPQIQELSLSENRIGNKGVKALMEGLPQSSQLRKLELKMCGIDDAVSKPLAFGVSRCALLEEIVLSWNALGDGSTLQLAQILPGMERLRVLDLDYNKITDCGVRRLAEELTRCRRIQSVRMQRKL